jgi:hypothetical protein
MHRPPGIHACTDDPGSQGKRHHRQASSKTKLRRETHSLTSRLRNLGEPGEGKAKYQDRNYISIGKRRAKRSPVVRQTEMVMNSEFEEAARTSSSPAKNPRKRMRHALGRL